MQYYKKNLKCFIIKNKIITPSHHRYFLFFSTISEMFLCSLFLLHKIALFPLRGFPFPPVGDLPLINSTATPSKHISGATAPSKRLFTHRVLYVYFKVEQYVCSVGVWMNHYNLFRGREDGDVWPFTEKKHTRYTDRTRTMRGEIPLHTYVCFPGQVHNAHKITTTVRLLRFTLQPPSCTRRIAKRFCY